MEKADANPEPRSWVQVIYGKTLPRETIRRWGKKRGAVHQRCDFMWSPGSDWSFSKLWSVNSSPGFVPHLWKDLSFCILPSFRLWLYQESCALTVFSSSYPNSQASPRTKDNSLKKGASCEQLRAKHKKLGAEPTELVTKGSEWKPIVSAKVTCAAEPGHLLVGCFECASHFYPVCWIPYSLLIKYLFFYSMANITAGFIYCRFSWWRETNSINSKTRNPRRGYINLIFQLPIFDSPCSTEGQAVGWCVRVCQLPPGWLEHMWAEVVPRRKGWCWAVGPMVLNSTTQCKWCRLHMLSGTSFYSAPFWYLNWERKHN